MKLISIINRLSLFIPIVTTIAFESCSKQDLTVLPSPAINKVENDIGISDIYDFLLKERGVPSTKSQSVSIVPILNGNDTVMFLVNYCKGWELLSGDRRAPRILIKSANGNATISGLKHNPQCTELFNRLVSGLSYLKHNSRIVPPDDMSDSWEKPTLPNDTFALGHLGWVFEDYVYTLTENREQDHLLETHWGMDPPWNQCSPYTDSTRTSHCLSGCVIVAVGQTLKYLHDVYQMPVGICFEASCDAYVPTNEPGMVLMNSDVEFYDFSEDNWGYLALNANDSAGVDNVAAFLLYLGYRHGAVFRRQGAATGWFGMIPAKLSEFSITCQTTNINNNTAAFISACEQDIYTDELPILLSLLCTDTYNGSLSGHVAVADGYLYQKYRKDAQYGLYMIDNNGNIIPGLDPIRHKVIAGTTFEEQRYVAINWGWNGNYDGDPDSPIWYNVYNNWLIGLTSDYSPTSIIHALTY